jgi:prophage regulatory protein
MDEQILREKEVLKVVGLSRSSLWRKERLGVFPPRRKLGIGGRAVGWLRSELEAWLKNLQTPASASGSESQREVI